ncbi:unnamed protein product, partial [Heterosigma akashiwo]
MDAAPWTAGEEGKGRKVPATKEQTRQSAKRAAMRLFGAQDSPGDKELPSTPKPTKSP